MARTDHCPICNVAVKPENLLRHVNDTHPRHPDTPALREKLKAEPKRLAPKRAAAPIRIRGWQVGLVILIIVGGAGGYYLSQYVRPGVGQPFPCVTGPTQPPNGYHWHTQLQIYSGGAPYTIPANTGFSTGCAEPLHTHDTSGLIHVESDALRLYTIGDFFLVWGKPFDSPTQMLVNGTAAAPSPGVTLYDSETITLYYASFS